MNQPDATAVSDREPSGSADGIAGARWGSQSRAFIIVAGLVLLFFALWESVERRWGTSSADSRLHALHLVRGIGASLAAAAVVAWLIGAASPSPARAAPRGERWWVAGQQTPTQWARDYGRWFILMRWIAVGVSAGLIFFTTQVAPVLPHDLWLPLAATVAALAASNVCYGLLLRRGIATDHLVPVQIGIDLLLLTVLLHFSGGIENPLSLLMVFHVIIAGIVLDRRRCFLAAAVASALYALLAMGEWSGLLPHYPLFIFPHAHGELAITHAAHWTPYVMSSIGVQTVVLFLTAYFVSTLAERVLYDERELVAMAERAMAERQLLERAMETTRTGLRVLDRNIREEWVNEQWKQLLPSAGAAGKDEVGTVNDAARRTVADGQVRLSELASDSCGNGGAARRILQVTTAPLYDQANHVTQIAELVQDVTQQREAQARLVQSNRLAAMGEMAGQIAHEVNNPIAIISAKARLLMGDHAAEMSPHVSAELDKIASQADRVARVAQGLLTYCRPAQRQSARLDLRLPIERALDLIEQRARAAGVEVVNEVQQLPDVVGNCDEMEQVFCNLFLNAVDAMSEGGGGRLSVQGRCEVDQVEVTVRDTGRGMDPHVRRRLFEPFFSTKSHSGTGLGLAICQELVQGSGGTIDVVASEPGSGSTFRVRLPLVAKDHA